MRREPTTILGLLIVVLALAVAACGTPNDSGDDASLPTDASGSGDQPIDGAVSLGEALAYMGRDPIAVEGFVVIDGAGARICESLAESFPPQCGGAHLDITNPGVLTDLPLVEEASTQWTDTYVTLFGDVNENLFTVRIVSP